MPAEAIRGAAFAMGGSTMGKFRILLSFLLVAGVFASGVSWSGLAVAAEDCTRSFLDERYGDRDGNLPADMPTAPADGLDPDTINLSQSDERRGGITGGGTC